MSTRTYEPTHTWSQCDRIARLSPSARRLFLDILTIMKEAELLSGPHNQEYLELMQAVIDDASERQDICRVYVMD